MIVNLQKTPKDKKANLVIHAKSDDVMQQLISRLQMPIGPYTREDAVCIGHSLKMTKPAQERNNSCTIYVRSIHGPKCPMPLVQQVDISFEVCNCFCVLSNVLASTLLI